MANFVIDGNLFKSIQSAVKRETERFLGKGNGISVSLPEIREFVVDNQADMFANGGKPWVVNYFVEQIKSQQNSLVVSTPTNSSIIIEYNDTVEDSVVKEETSTLLAPKSQNLAVREATPECSSLGLPAEILTEIQTRFANHSQEVQEEVITHLQELKIQSAIDLRSKLNELGNLESRLLRKVLSDYQKQEEDNLLAVRESLSKATTNVGTKAENFTQEFNKRIRDAEMMFGL